MFIQKISSNKPQKDTSECASSRSDIISIQTPSSIKILSEAINNAQKASKVPKILSSYTPVKNDRVDEALAGYINKHSRHLSSSFVRENSGVYTVGKRRVGIKLEHGNLYVRSAGKCVRIKEFLSNHFPQEMSYSCLNSSRKESQVSLRRSNSPLPSKKYINL